MSAVHLVVGASALVATLAAVALGLSGWRSGAASAFWAATRTAQALIAAQVLLGVMLLMVGHHPHVPTHPLYGFLALLAVAGTEAARVRAGDAALGRPREAAPIFEDGAPGEATGVESLRAAGRAEARATTVGMVLTAAVLAAAGASSGIL